MPGTLFVVATPIGNLDDITLRALEVLRRVALVACEDTRRTRKLFVRHGIGTPCVACHKFNEHRSTERLLETLRGGSDVALVTDAGTPAISDPGSLLVASAVAEGIEVRPVPGASAVVAALSASGLPAGPFTFRGVLPHRAGERRRALAAVAGAAETQVFYESPIRVASTLADMRDMFGDRDCSVVREMTKRFEQWYRGPLSQVAGTVAARPGRGEYCIIVAGAATGSGARGEGSGKTAAPSTIEALAGEFRRLQESGLDRREALRRLAREKGLSRSEIYRRLMEATAAPKPGGIPGGSVDPGAAAVETTRGTDHQTGPRGKRRADEDSEE